MVGNSSICALRVGEWDWAIALLDEWLGLEVTASGFMEFFVDRAILRALRGQGDGAVSDIAEAARLRATATDPQFESYELLARAWAALAAGDLVGVRGHAKRAAEITEYFQPLALPVAARAALWTGDAVDAERALATFLDTDYWGPALEVDRAVAQAGVTALNGRGAEALAAYREALRGYRALGLAFDESLAVIDMATVLPTPERDAPDVTVAIDHARQVLERLGAGPLLARLDAVVAARGKGSTRGVGASSVGQAAVPSPGSFR
jgi:tetratricopeptide (TPR) repeat protein